MSGVVTAHQLMQDGFELFGGVVLEGWAATVDLPLGAHYLTVGSDRRGDPTLWVLSSGEGGTTARRFAVVGDGATPDGINLHHGDYVGSIVGGAAFHVFEIQPEGVS